ncbi:hypothetical protein GCM10010517_70930 [Streptosporangium fragile]|uniref:Beta/gamma crystallin 'Greek key' domain-containing protein n=1 Tax=Streptosporangium fragile TaxID=46186 RepID=A0ABP6IQL6_9ACTN
MKKNFRIAITGTALALSVGFSGAASPAQAEEKGLQLYASNEFEGSTRVWSDSVPRLKNYDAINGYTWNDMAASVKNTDDVAWVLYDDSDYRDRRFCLRSGESVTWLEHEQWRFNKKTSSIRRLTLNSCVGYPAFYNYG